MALLEQYARRAEAISRIGERVREEARQAGTSISYMDLAFGDDVIREWPDGHRERRKADGSVEPIPPRGR